MQVPQLTYYSVSGPLNPYQTDSNFQILQDFSNGLASLVGVVVNDDTTLASNIIGSSQLIPGALTGLALADQSLIPNKIANVIAGPGLVKATNAAPISINTDNITVGLTSAYPNTTGQLFFQTNPANGDTLTITINSTPIAIQFVTTIGVTAGNVLIGANNLATLANLINLIIAPSTTNTTQVAVSSGAQTLLGYTAYSVSGYTLTIGDNGAHSLTSISMTPSTVGVQWITNTSSQLLAYGAGSCAILDDSVANNTAGPTWTNTSLWNPRVLLNIVRNQNTIVVSLDNATGKFVLNAGTYRLMAWSTAYNAGVHKAKLVNFDTSTDILVGTSASCSTNGSSLSMLNGTFTVALGVHLQIQHRIGANNANNGGQPCNFTENEVYCQVQLWKEA